MCSMITSALCDKGKPNQKLEIFQIPCSLASFSFKLFLYDKKLYARKKNSAVYKSDKYYS